MVNNVVPIHQNKRPPDLVHQPCPFVGCESSDAFSFWNEGTGFCQSCTRSYPSKEQLKDWATEIYPPIRMKANPKTAKIEGHTYEGIRGIDPEVCKMYGIQLQYDEDGEPVRYAYKYPHTVKYRDYNDKSNTWVKDVGVGMAELFGPEFNSGSSKRIYLTEGEFDAASLHQITKYPVKSLPSAAISEKFLKRNFEYLNSFQEIVYAGELDAAGRGAAEKLYPLFPEKFYYVPMSKHKDANDFLMNGDADELKWAAFKPQRYTPDNFHVGDVAVETAIRTENPYEYTPTGHSGLDDKIRGLVKGGLTFIKAPRGTGKTELIRYLEMGLLNNSDNSRVGLLHMEEMKSTTYRAMATYYLGVNVRTKEDAAENDVTEDYVVEAAQLATQGDRTVVFEMRSHDSPLTLLDHVRLGATVYGVTHFFIDHVQRLAYLSTQGVDAATSTLTTLGARMAQLAKELNVCVCFISQVNDDGRTKYAASLEEEAIICIKIQRDTESEDETERNTTEFVVDKNRPFSALGSAGKVYYNPETTILEEVVFDV